MRKQQSPDTQHSHRAKPPVLHTSTRLDCRSPPRHGQSRIWVTCALEGKPLPVPQTLGRQHAEFVRAAYKSAETGHPVQLPLATDDPYYSFEGRLTRPDWMPRLSGSRVD